MTKKAISPLRRRMIEDMTIRGLADKTQTGYIRHIKNFSIFFGRSPDQATTEDVRLYQLHMKTSGASVNTMAAPSQHSSSSSTRRLGAMTSAISFQPRARFASYLWC